MKMKNWKNSLKKEAKNFVPNIKEQIMQKLGITSKQKPLLKINLRLVSLFSLFLVAFIIIIFSTSRPVLANSIVSIDINPSLELEINKDNQVKAIRAMNIDGALLIQDNKEELLNISSQASLLKILEYADEIGYLNGQNEVNLVVANNSKLQENKIKKFLEKHFINNVTNQFTNITVSINKEDEASLSLAKTRKITIGRALLISKALKNRPNLSYEETKEMPLKALNEYCHNYDEEKIADFIFEYEEKLHSFKQNHQAALSGEQNKYLREMIQEKYKQQLFILKNQIRELVNDQDLFREFILTFEDNLENDILQNADGKNKAIRDLNILLIRLKTMIKSCEEHCSQRKKQKIIEGYNEYRKLLAKTPENIQSSQVILNFEQIYQAFIKNKS